MGVPDAPVNGVRAIFLDRDGVLVEPVPDPAHPGVMESPYHADDVALTAGAAQAVRRLRSEGWLLVCVSNQPAAAKGTAPLAALESVHERMVALLAEHGARLDAFHYCFHHPQGVVAELAGDCACRKPAPGMLLTAADQLGLRLDACWMVGDSDSDVSAGHAVGCRTLLIEHPGSTHRRRGTARPTITAPDLETAAVRLSQYGVPGCSPPVPPEPE